MIYSFCLFVVVVCLFSFEYTFLQRGWERWDRMALLSCLDILFMSQSSWGFFKKSSSKDRSEKIRIAYVCMSTHSHRIMAHWKNSIYRTQLEIVLEAYWIVLHKNSLYPQPPWCQSIYTLQLLPWTWFFSPWKEMLLLLSIQILRNFNAKKASS